MLKIWKNLEIAKEKSAQNREMFKMLNCLGEIDPPPQNGGSVSPNQFNIFNTFNISPVLSTFFH